MAKRHDHRSLRARRSRYEEALRSQAKARLTTDIATGRRWGGPTSPPIKEIPAQVQDAIDAFLTKRRVLSRARPPR